MFFGVGGCPRLMETSPGEDARLDSGIRNWLKEDE